MGNVGSFFGAYLHGFAKFFIWRRIIDAGDVLLGTARASRHGGRPVSPLYAVFAKVSRSVFAKHFSGDITRGGSARSTIGASRRERVCHEVPHRTHSMWKRGARKNRRKRSRSIEGDD